VIRSLESQTRKFAQKSRDSGKFKNVGSNGLSHSNTTGIMPLGLSAITYKTVSMASFKNISDNIVLERVMSPIF